MVSDYPVMMRLAGRRVVVVGAGPVGLRKVDGLVATGARVVLIAPDADTATCAPEVERVSRVFAADDLDGAVMVFAATDDPEVNRSIADLAREQRVPVNIADDPERCDFLLPASFRRGNLTVAVASGGLSPAAVTMIRDEIENNLPEEWALFLEIAGKLRSSLLTSDCKSAYNQQVLRKMVDRGILTMIAAADTAAIDRTLEEAFGRNVSLATLGISLSKGLP